MMAGKKSEQTIYISFAEVIITGAFVVLWECYVLTGFDKLR